MCIILIGKINNQQHTTAKQQNSDGFSVFTQDGLIKAPTDAQVKDVIDNKKFAIWHYRIGTSGSIDNFNIHPFECCHGDYYLYHNGVIGGGDATRSDTHCLADSLMDVDFETADTVLRSLSDNNRFVLVNKNNPYDYRLYGKWECEAGVLMSHKMYTYSYSSKPSNGYTSYYPSTQSSKDNKRSKLKDLKSDNPDYKDYIDWYTKNIRS